MRYLVFLLFCSNAFAHHTSEHTMEQINNGTFKPNVPTPSRASSAAELKACNDMVNRQPQPREVWMKQCTDNFKKYPAPDNYCFSGTNGTNPSFPCYNGCYQPTQYKMCVNDEIKCVPQSKMSPQQQAAGYCKAQ